MRYKVGGRIYTAPVKHGYAVSEKTIKTALASAYAPGGKVPVIYNPENPWQIYTPGPNEPPETLTSIAFCVLGLAFMLCFGIFGVIFWLSQVGRGVAEAA